MAELLDQADDSTIRLISVARSGVDPRRPSRLPGWTVGHVLAHVALNAEAFVRVAEGRRRDEIGIMYPNGLDGRQRDIDDLATRSIDEISERLEASRQRFRDAWSSPVPDGPCSTAEGHPTFAASAAPLRRLREVEVHGFDTGIEALTIDRWSDRYVDADLPDQWSTVARRTTEPVRVIDEVGTEWTTPTSSLTDPIVRCSRRALLAWILDRHAIAELPTLVSWGNQSAWGR